MDKQNEGIQDPAEAGDPGRHERFVTVDEEGRKKAIIKKNKDVLLFVPYIIRNGLMEVASYPEGYTLYMCVTSRLFNKASIIKAFC